MHFKSQKADLNLVTQIAQKAVSNRNPLPILSCLLLEAADNTFTVTATDLEMGIRCSVPAETVVEGSTALPAKMLASLISRLPDGEIGIETDVATNTTSFNYGVSNLTLNGFPAEEYPQFPSMPENPILKIQQNTFKKLLKRVLFALEEDNQRPIFNGANLNIDENGKMTMVATDTRRLAVCEETLEAAPDQPVNIIVPARALNEFSKLIEFTEDKFEVYLTENQVFFVVGDICMMSRLIMGQYPDYSVVLPQKFICEVKAPVSKIMETAERASLLANTRHNVLSASFQPEGLNISFNTESGRIQEKVPVDFLSGESLMLGLNVKLLIDQLKAVETEQVTIKVSGPKTPALFQPENLDGYFSILVPAML